MKLSWLLTQEFNAFLRISKLWQARSKEEWIAKVCLDVIENNKIIKNEADNCRISAAVAQFYICVLFLLMILFVRNFLDHHSRLS